VPAPPTIVVGVPGVIEFESQSIQAICFGVEIL